MGKIRAYVNNELFPFWPEDLFLSRKPAKKYCLFWRDIKLISILKLLNLLRKYYYHALYFESCNYPLLSSGEIVFRSLKGHYYEVVRRWMYSKHDKNHLA
jgi:hypothetical protein